MKKTGTIFDLYDTDSAEGQQGYMDIAENAPEPKDNSFFDTVKQYGKTALKGAVEGISSLGTIMGPLQTGTPRKQQLEQQTEKLNEILPTENTAGQNILRGALKEAPTAIATPLGSAGGAAIRGLTSGAAGETAKELGAPEWAQTVAKLAPYIAPDVARKLIEKGKYSDLIKEARKHGLSDEEISPLIQSDFKQKWFSKIASKKGATEERLSETKKALDSAYETLSSSPKASVSLSSESSNQLLSELSEIAGKIPAEARKRLSQDMLDFAASPRDGKSLFNLWKDLNYYISKGEKSAGLFKEPIKKALNSIDPELAKDFETINKLYTKFFPIAQKLKPGVVDSFVSAAETLGAAGAVFSWNLPFLASIVGKKVASKISANMLTDPRYQQLSEKMVKAVTQNNFSLAKNAIDGINELLEDSGVDKKSLPTLTEEQFETFFNPKE